MGLELIPASESGNPSEDALEAAARLLRDEFDLRTNIQAGRLALEDAWLMMYLLVDRGQDGQPSNRSKHYTSTLSSIVDTARRVLSRNPIKYHVTSQMFKGQSREEREPQRNLENVLHGMLYDIDKQLLGRGEMRSRQQAAFHALVRGAWAYKLHLSTKTKNATGSPIFYQQIDPRLALPDPDVRGMSSVIVGNTQTISQLMYAYPEKMAPVVEHMRSMIRARRSYSTSGVIGASASSSLQSDFNWMHAPVAVIEWSSREESGVLADFGSLPSAVREAVGIRPDGMGGVSGQFFWLESPYRHGFDHSLIQYGNVNGIPMGMNAQLSAELMTQGGGLPTNRMPLSSGTSQTEGYVNAPTLFLPNGQMHQPVAATIDGMGMYAGRSIYSMITHMIPELNTLMATLKDAVIKEVRGTWTLTTRDGRLMQMEAGTGKLIPLQFGERLERIPMQIQSPDALAVVQLLKQEIADSTLDLRFILASESDAGGYLRARMEQAALIALDDYKDGQQNWATSVAESFTKQFRKARKNAFKNWTVSGRMPGAMTNFFVVDVDGAVAEALHAKEPPLIEATVKPSMPIDMMAKINMAKSAIDPSNPVMGLAMALDIILELDDADAAYDMIFEDIANRDPTIQLLHIANAMAENNAPEVAQMILSDTFRNAFRQARAGQSGQGGTPPATSTPAGASPGIPSSAAPPEMTTGGGTESAPAPQGGGG